MLTLEAMNVRVDHKGHCLYGQIQGGKELEVDMDREEAVAAALAFLRKRGVRANERTPVIATFEKADHWVKYDRWELLFETQPGMHPSDTAVEIKCPENALRVVPLM